MNIGKYSFPSKEMAIERIQEQEDNGHTFVELGFIIKEQGVYENDIEITPPIFSTKYSVDVMWLGLDTHPFGWEEYYTNLLNEGTHMFSGCNYEDYKFKT